MELWRKKNTETRIVFPIMKNDGTLITGATGLDSEYAILGAHGAAAPSFADCEHEATEIGSTGLYYLDVAAGEINGDHVVIQVKSSSTGAVTQVILIRTTAADADAVKVSGTAQTAGDLAALITTVDGPVLSADAVEIVKGDDYDADDGRELEFTGSGWPTLTGGTVEVIIDGTGYACTVTAADTFTLELTAAQTDLIDAGTYTFTAVLTKTTRHITLLVGSITVREVPEEDA